MSVRTDESTTKKLDRIAESLDRNRNWVIHEAIHQYLDLHSWQDEQIQNGIADSNAGRTITTDQLRALIHKRPRSGIWHTETDLSFLHSRVPNR